jgi:uncharacterized protein
MIVPIFPLPNVVLFPKTLLPLHIFEQRYRTMTREALDGDGRIVIALLKEGWEAEYEKSPPVHDIACVAQIESHQELEGGKYNIVVAGLQRVRVVREIEHTPYRLAEVEVMPELTCDEEREDVIRRRDQLGALFCGYSELATSTGKRKNEVILELEFEALVNMTATVLNLPAEERQALLEVDAILERCDLLIPILQRHLEALILVRKFEHLKPEDPRMN